MNSKKTNVSDALPIFNFGDKIDIGTGYSGDRGKFLRYEGNCVVWESELGGIYKSPIDQYNIQKC